MGDIIKNVSLMTEYQRPGTLILEDKRFKLQFDPPALWSNIRQALVSAGNNEWGGVADALLKGTATFAAANTLEHKAFCLLFNALQSACVGVMTDRMDQRQLMEKLLRAGPLATDFYRTMSRHLSTAGYELDLEFWANPKQHPAVKDTQAEYESFLTQTFGMHDQQAKVLAAALPSRFVQALAAEWERADYSAVRDHFANNPFLKTLQQQAIHDKRHADLQSRFAKPAFDDPRVTLAEMYIEPYCWVHHACLHDQKEHGFTQIKNKQGGFPYCAPANPLGLHDYVASWLKGKKTWQLPGENSPLLVLLGQPGQGKTSFCLRTADQLLRECPNLVDQLYFLRLRDMTKVTRLIEDPLAVVAEALDIPRTEHERGLPITALRNSLLLLDGLDELYMSQGLTMHQINDFVRNLTHRLQNNADLNCRVILTSRTHYLKLEDQQPKDFLVLHLAELNLDQQVNWLKKYENHYGSTTLNAALLEEVNNETKPTYKAIRELINQPILLHLVAVSGVQLETTLNAAKIYEDLFDLMIQRKWSPQDGQLDKYKNVGHKDLRHFLQRLALYIFQSDHEYVKRSDFERHESDLKLAVEKLRKKMGSNDLSVQDLVKDLLVSFYFQETTRVTDEKKTTEDPDHYAFEFLHKSLQEYLTAELIWEECKYKLLQKDQHDDYTVQNWQQAMRVIAPLFEKKMISQEIADYLREIIQNDGETAIKAEVKQRIKALWPGLLDHQFLLQHSAGDNTLPLEKITGNFFGYWTLASVLMAEHPLPLPSDPDDEKAFKTAIAAENLIHEGQQKHFVRTIKLLMETDSRRLDLRYQALRGADLSGADLSGADLRGTDLRGAYLLGAYLIGAYLSGADLSGAYLSGAYLRGAYLRGAYLSGADLSGADLSGAYLIGAYLSGADLSGVKNLENANYLEDANFEDTIYAGKFGKGATSQTID